MIWKRKDISTEIVLKACVEAHSGKSNKASWEIIIEKTGAPEKIIYAAMERDCNNGYIEYGVSLRTGWITEKGKQYLTGGLNDKT